jgi:hypothetical protein
MLKKLAILKNYIYLKRLCSDTGINYNALTKRVARDTPELNEKEKKKIDNYLKKLKALL